jgi:hypothetical protein
MGYYVRALPWKKSAPKWKLQFISYKKADVGDSPAKNPKKEWDVHRDRLRPLGFHSRMSITDAKARAKQINAQRWIKEQEKRIQRKAIQEIEARRKLEAGLPSEFVAEFENRFLRVRDSEIESGRRKRTRARIIWTAAQKMISTIPVDPTDWFYHTLEMYDYFQRQKYSIRYAQAILRFANLWGFFISKKLGHPFLPVPAPKGFERMRIIDANCEKTGGVRKASTPLTPDDLDCVSGKMNQPNFRWIFLTVWLGLRPKEVDNLKDASLWKVEILPTGRKVLWVYQTKIIALPPEDRWKPIPILFEQQEFALRIIESQNFRRPIMKTMKRHFAAGIDLYGGRKGFSDLMLSKGQLFENISIWMGHSTLDRTWRSYKQKRVFHI